MSLGYLGVEDEQELLQRRLRHGWAPPTLSAVVDAETLLAMRESLELVQVEPSVLRYIVSVVHASRAHPHVTVGASPRGGLALVALARGQAILDRRDYVTPEDVKAVAVPALAHRISLRPELWVRRVTSADVVTDLLDSVEVPR